MFDFPKQREKLSQFRLGLIVSNYFSAALSDETLGLVAALPPEQRYRFFLTMEKRSAKLLHVYAAAAVFAHYLLLGRRAMAGWFWCSLILATALGLLWWLIDLVRLPRMVRAYNGRVALEIAEDLSRQQAHAEPRPGEPLLACPP